MKDGRTKKDAETKTDAKSWMKSTETADVAELFGGRARSGIVPFTDKDWKTRGPSGDVDIFIQIRATFSEGFFWACRETDTTPSRLITEYVKNCEGGLTGYVFPVKYRDYREFASTHKVIHEEILRRFIEGYVAGVDACRKSGRVPQSKIAEFAEAMAKKRKEQSEQSEGNKDTGDR